MAKNSIVFSMVLNNTDFVKNLNLSRGEVRKLESQFSKTEGTLTKMVSGGLAPMIGKLAGVAGGAALVGGALSRSTEKMMEMDSALSEMKALLGATKEQMADFKESALAMASSSTVAASDIVRAMIKVGGAMPQLLDFEQGLKNVTQSAITLSEASGMGLDESINSLTGIMNQFGASAMDSDRFINALAAASQAGSAEIDYLSEAIAKSGGAATSANLEFEELVSLIEAIAPKFGKAEEAGTALRGVLLKMETGEERTKISTQGLAAALDELAKMNSDQMLKKFGVEGYNMAKAMVEARESFAKFNTEVRGTNAAEEQARVRADNLRTAIDGLVNKWDAFTTSINNSNGPLKDFVNLLGAALDKMADFAAGGTEQEKWLGKQKRAIDRQAPKEASEKVSRWVNSMGVSKEEAVEKVIDEVSGHIQVYEGRGEVGKSRGDIKLALEGILGSKWEWTPGAQDLTRKNFGAGFNDYIASPLARYGAPVASFLGGGAIANKLGASLTKSLIAGAAGGSIGYMSSGMSSKDLAGKLNTMFPSGDMQDLLRLHKLYQMLDYLEDYKKSLKGGTTTAGGSIEDSIRTAPINVGNSPFSMFGADLVEDISKFDQEIKGATISVADLGKSYQNPWVQKYQTEWEGGNAYQRIGFANDAAGTVANGIGSVGNLISDIPGLEAIGEPINRVTSTMMDVMNAIQGISNIIEMVNGVGLAGNSAVVGGNTTALVANTLALNKMSLAMATKAMTDPVEKVGKNMLGGIMGAIFPLPIFADGGIVGGSSWTGDKLLARVNSGEMILNADQQKGLLNGLKGTPVNIRIQPGEMRIQGESLFMTLKNYMEQTGNKF